MAWPDARPSLAAVVRWLLLGACLAALIPLVWKVGEISAELQQSARAKAAYDLGADMHADGRLEEAADAFRNAIALSPQMLGAHRRLAKVEVARGRYDEAIATYRQIMADYPFSRLSTLYREMALIELHADRLDDAHEDLLRALTIDPRDWRAHNLLGRVYLRQGDKDRARAARRLAHELKQGRLPGR